jgi:hypothetical protein
VFINTGWQPLVISLLNWRMRLPVSVVDSSYFKSSFGCSLNICFAFARWIALPEKVLP